MNHKVLPFTVSKTTWGNLTITVDKIDNIRKSRGSWYCDAYTLSEKYDERRYGTKGEHKIIGTSGNYSWNFEEEKEYDTSLLPNENNQSVKPKSTYKKPKSVKGLTQQKAAKTYKCFCCGKTIKKGSIYERYKMSNPFINEVFIVGHRDKMREKFFNKKNEDITFQELQIEWDKENII
jgi:hypothetical protein